MRAIDGHLPVNTKYKPISVTYQGDNFTTCQNCDKVINTVAIIENESGVRYSVGDDCAEHLMGCNSLECWQLKQKAKKANQLKRYVAKLRKAERENRLEIKNGWYYILDKPNEYNWSIRIMDTSESIKLFRGKQ